MIITEPVMFSFLQFHTAKLIVRKTIHITMTDAKIPVISDILHPPQELQNSPAISIASHRPDYQTGPSDS